MDDGIRRAVGGLLRQLRVSRGWSLARVEELTGQAGRRVSRSRLSQVERGDVPVTLDDVQVLCRVYGVGLVDLFTETLAAHAPDAFPPDWDHGRLFEEGKTLFAGGRLLRAGWAFDEAARRAEENDQRAMALLAAGHSYERFGSRDLALRRVEQALDLFDDGSEREVALRCLGKLAVLLAGRGARLRARLVLDRLREVLQRRRRPDEVRAYLLGTMASALLLLGDPREAVQRARQAARLYDKLGDATPACQELAVAAQCLAEEGQVRRALELVPEIRQRLDSVTRTEARIIVDLALGDVALAAGDFTAASEHYRAAHDLARNHGIGPRIRQAAEKLAALARRQGHPGDARRWEARAARTPGYMPEGGMPLLAPLWRPEGEERRTP